MNNMQSGDKDNDDAWLASMEEGYLQAMAAEPDYEAQYINEREDSMRNMWGHFQESATSIAQMYRDRLNTNDTGALWLPFQTAAGTVTTLYKESNDGLKRTNETAIHCGYQRRTREVADWARKKNRRYIRREELLAYLAGKPAPPLHSPKSSTVLNNPNQHPHANHHSPSVMVTNKQLDTVHQRNPHNHHRHHHHSNHLHHPHHHLHRELVAAAEVADAEAELDIFQEALALKPSRTPELYAFVAGEIARHCKRPGSPLDINMDAPSLNSKRQRFL